MDKTSEYIQHFFINEIDELHVDLEYIFSKCIDNEKVAAYINQINYKVFLNSLYWKTISIYVKQKADNRCQLCSSQSCLNTHHRSYKNHGYEHTEIGLKDLVILCDKCHNKFHNILSSPAHRYLSNYITNDRRYFVVKSNNIIQNCSYHLSTQEQKIILYLISKIKPTDKEFESYSFSVVEFCNIYGIDSDNGTNYSNLKSTIKSLTSKSLLVKLKKNTQSLVRWINKAKIIENSGIVEIRLDDDMKPYLLELKNNFTQYELLYTLAMKSQYSIRLYEILKSYEYKKSIIYEVDDLKQILLAENYTLFGDFKRRVIDVAINEINSLSDIWFGCQK